MREPARTTIEEDLKILDAKLNQLKREYDQYFLGTRPREPMLLAAELRKTVARLSNTPFQNTAMKFRFATVCSRYQAFNRQWQDTLRKIDQGSYERHQFKARLRERDPAGDPASTPAAAPPAGGKLDDPNVYQAYIEARRACGQSVDNLSPAKLQAVLKKQAAQICSRHGAADVRFRVVVEDGKAKLKASREAS